MAIKNFPCKNCKNRAAGCHSYCDDYNKAKINYEKEKEYEQRLRNVDDFIIKSTIRKNTINRKIYMRKNYED